MLSDGEFYIPVNGINLWVKIASSSLNTIPLVIIHGGPGGNNYVFERTTGIELEKHFTVIYYEQRGCGRSKAPKDASAYSNQILIDELHQFLHELNIPKIIPLGYSYGGEIALEFATKYPNSVEKVIAQAPTLFGNQERIFRTQLRGFSQIASKEMKLKIEEIIKSELTMQEKYNQVWNIADTDTVDKFLFIDQKIASLNRKMWEESKLVNTGVMFKVILESQKSSDLLEKLKLLTKPVLLIVGLYDRNVGLDLVRDFHAAILNSQMLIFNHSAHFPDLEESDRFIQEIVSFLQI